jgi:hypothetical protein
MANGCYPSDTDTMVEANVARDIESVVSDAVQKPEREKLHGQLLVI